MMNGSVALLLLVSPSKLVDFFEFSSFDDFLWHVTTDCVTRTFPREKLVYLSPDSPNVLQEYSHDDIYILGALIDKRIPRK